MRFDPDSLAMQELKKCVDHLIRVCQHLMKTAPVNTEPSGSTHPYKTPTTMLMVYTNKAY